MNDMGRQLETFSQLWLEGETASRIASLLGSGFDDIGLRMAAIESAASALERSDESAPKTVPQATPASSSVTIAGLTDETCRWPIDDLAGAELQYCGAPAVGTGPYCARHSKMAYLPTRPARRPPARNALIPHLRG